MFSLNPRLQNLPEKASLIEDLRLGWKEFTAHTWLWVIVLQFSFVVAALGGVFGLLGPAIAREEMNGAIDWGFISASFGVGTLIGGLLAMKVKVKYPMRLGTLLVFSFCSLPLTLSIPLPVYFVALAALFEGVAGQIFAVLWYTSIQRKVPSHLLSRVSAYDHLGSIVLAPLGIVAAGFLYEAIGGRSTLLIIALIVFIPTLLAFMVRDVRMMTSD